MALRPHRAGSGGPLAALAAALVAMVALSGCAYNTAATATTTSAPQVATSTPWTCYGRSPSTYLPLTRA